MRDHGNRDLAPVLDQPWKKAGLFQLELWFEVSREVEAFPLQIGCLPDQMRRGQLNGEDIFGHLVQTEPEEAQKVRELVAVDSAQRVKLEDARGELACFDVREPRMRDVKLRIILRVGDLLAQPLNLTRSHAKASTQRLKLLSGH